MQQFGTCPISVYFSNQYILKILLVPILWYFIFSIMINAKAIANTDSKLNIAKQNMITPFQLEKLL